MDIRYYFCKPVLLSILLWSCPGFADTPGISVGNEPAGKAFTLKGIYEFTCDGLLFGRIGIEVEPLDPIIAGTGPRQEYDITLDVQSAGLISIFTNHSSHATLKFYHDSPKNCVRCAPDTASSVYETNYLTKKKPRHVQLIYKAGQLVHEVVEPPEDPAKRPGLSTDIKNNAVDPLNFLIKIHNALVTYASMKNVAATPGDFTIDVYDGRRVTRVDFAFIGKQKISYEGNETPVIALTVKRIPVAGFTEKELADIGPNEPSASFYVEDAPALTPLRLEAHVWFGTLAATLVKRCGAEESCLLGNTE